MQMQTGELTESIKKRSVFRPLHMEVVKASGLCKEALPGRSGLVCSTVGPLPGYRKSPWRQVTAAANAVAARGGVPLAVSLQGLLPTTYEESRLREDMKKFAAEIRENGLHDDRLQTDSLQANELQRANIGKNGDPPAGGLEARDVPLVAGLEMREEQPAAEMGMQKDPPAGGLEILDAQIQVSDQVSFPQYFVTCLGSTRINNGSFQVWGKDIGECPEKPHKAEKLAALESIFLQPGQELILTRQIALAGTAAIARAREEELLRKFPAWLVERAKGFDQWMSVRDAAETVRRFGVRQGIAACPMHCLSEGGIFNALWKMAETSHVGLEINLREIPIRQETVEICETFDINPYYLYSEGALLIGTGQAAQLLGALQDAGIPAAVIGRATDKNDRLIHNGENCRYLDRPKQDELWRFGSYLG